MAFYNLGSGGDVTNNPNHAIYPQHAFIAGVSPGQTLLRPAEHMSPATYNIWRNINFGEEKHPTNWGVREFVKQLYASGNVPTVDDILGLVTVPHEAIVAGIHLRVENGQEDTELQLVRVNEANPTGLNLGVPFDATAPGVYFYGETAGGSFVVPDTTNESIGLKIVGWPAPATPGDLDPCGVYGPCDDLTLCVTISVFIWSPVAERFCKSDPCFGASSVAGPRDY